MIDTPVPNNLKNIVKYQSKYFEERNLLVFLQFSITILCLKLSR